jgi:hypothetical protein
MFLYNKLFFYSKKYLLIHIFYIFFLKYILNIIFIKSAYRANIVLNVLKDKLLYLNIFQYVNSFLE